MEEDEVEYDEAFVHVANEKRISRNIRFRWLVDALQGQNDPYDTSSPVHLIGQVPFTEKTNSRPRSVITTKTDVQFIFQRYRYVFILDLSASAFRINDLTFELIVHELFAAFKLFIQNLIQPFRVPGQFDQTNFLKASGFYSCSYILANSITDFKVFSSPNYSVLCSGFLEKRRDILYLNKIDFCAQIMLKKCSKMLRLESILHMKIVLELVAPTKA